ncbi:hypothetical protein BDQ12DRAFT_606116, partial [Crucibulum laeve]
TDIPEEETLITDAQLLLEDSLTWREGKVIGNVRTFHSPRSDESPHSGEHWTCVVSEHKKQDISFKNLWEKVGRNKALNQKRFIPEIAKVTRIKYISDSQSIWSMLYTCPPPLSPRVFTVLQVVRLIDYPANGRTGLIMTIPVDLSSNSNRTLAELEEKGVKGRYVSVEHIKELNGSVIEWRRIASGDPGGLIPRFYVERTMAEKMIEVSNIMYPFPTYD